MNIKDLNLNQFGIELKNTGNNEYQSMIIDSNLFQDLFDYFNYSLDGLTLDEDSVNVNEETNDVTFKGDGLEVELKADFNKDEYQIIVRGDN